MLLGFLGIVMLVTLSMNKKRSSCAPVDAPIFYGSKTASDTVTRMTRYAVSS